MPTFNQLVRKGREQVTYKSTSPALVSYTHLDVYKRQVTGRVRTYESIVKGHNVPTPGVPESFRVLLKELQSLCLNIQVLDKDGNVVDLKEDEDALDTFNLSRMDADDDRHRNVAEDAEFEASGFEFEDAPEDAGADVDVDFDDE